MTVPLLHVAILFATIVGVFGLVEVLSGGLRMRFRAERVVFCASVVFIVAGYTVAVFGLGIQS